MAKARDPVCGMMVDTDKAPAKGVYDGKSVYFCSTSCRDSYAASHKAS